MLPYTLSVTSSRLNQPTDALKLEPALASQTGALAYSVRASQRRMLIMLKMAITLMIKRKMMEKRGKMRS